MCHGFFDTFIPASNGPKCPGDGLFSTDRNGVKIIKYFLKRFSPLQTDVLEECCMADEKIDNLLNISLSLTERERERDPELEAGFDSEAKTWEVVVKYHGSLDGLLQYGVTVTYLYGGYAVLNIPENYIEQVALLPQIEYMEKPKNLYFEVADGKAVSCFKPVQKVSFSSGMLSFGGLTGKGTIVAVIDSGVDYRHPDFRNDDGTTRILYIWDQSAGGEPPAGYNMGVEYTAEQINEALLNDTVSLPVSDSSGHGTHVLGIAAGNGRASNGLQTGCAPESEMIVVKLGRQRSNSFPMTTELMQGINYVLQKAIELEEPVAINISFGNSYGAHEGDSLLETYIDQAVGIWKNVIVIGTGNEGSTARHVSGKFETGSTAQDADVIELLIYRYTQAFGIQIWKSYVDDIEISLVAPDGTQTVIVLNVQDTIRYRLYNTELLVYFGKPSPYSINQEIYIEMIPDGDFFEGGVWSIKLRPLKVVDGRYNLWLPSGAILNNGTGFLRPVADMTLTIPSTADKVISVGAYDGATDSVAFFSGRGYTASGAIKPDIIAPGVNIMSAAPGGGYVYRSGTSMATPFVTGAASCMMQWGIVNGNDPYLYGEKMKAYLRKGARMIPGYESYPNQETGWGALCVDNSIPG